ncbi:MAG: rod shape-determining protein RodA [Flavobacteriales bacterium]|nr:rod shape-determining protein RodA [Flavobacteriales bacterium]
MRVQESISERIDWVLVLTYVTFLFIGWTNIFSSSYNEAHPSIFDLSQNYGKQLLWIGTSIVLAFIILVTHYDLFNKMAYLIYGIIMFILLLVLGIGDEIAGSKSWITLGSFKIQPSEFAKFATCLALAKYMSSDRINFKRIRTRLTVVFIILLPALLILLQNDTGSTLVFFSLIFVLYRMGLPGNILLFGVTILILFVLALLINQVILSSCIAALGIFGFWQVQKKKIDRMIVVAVMAVSIAFTFSVDYVFENILEPHQKQRIEVLLGIQADIHGAGYNINQSKIAIGSGGFAGKGYLQGTQTKFDFVPEQSTDFIFCTIGEEWGFLGSMFTIGLYVFLLLRIINLAERQKLMFAKLYGYGVASIFFFHFGINIGMTIGLAPIIGIPLPFLSYGGSSLWSFTILLFILINQDFQRKDILGR